MTIQKKVDDLIKKYGTTNPFELADFLGIMVVYENLGKSLGYFSNICRIPIIHINDSISYEKQLFTIAHELGHAVLHPNENTAFLKANTLYSTEKIEVEANTFAIELLFNGNNSITIKEAIEEYGAPKQLLYKNFYP